MNGLILASALNLAASAPAGTTPEPYRHTVVPKEMTTGQMTALQNARGVYSSFCWGTDYGVSYWLGSRTPQLEIGDRVRFHVTVMKDAGDSTGCASFDLTTTIGEPGLPFALDWVLFDDSDVDWSEPIRAPKEILDDRFTGCGPDSDGMYNFRAQIAERDTTGRAHLDASQGVLRRVVMANENSQFVAFADDLETLVQRNPTRLSYQALSALFLAESGRCREYERRLKGLVKAGLLSPGSIARQMKFCRVASDE